MVPYSQLCRDAKVSKRSQADPHSKRYFHAGWLIQVKIKSRSPNLKSDSTNHRLKGPGPEQGKRIFEHSPVEKTVSQLKQERT